jgi:hypothetical protein
VPVNERCELLAALEPVEAAAGPGGSRLHGGRSGRARATARGRCAWRAGH